MAFASGVLGANHRLRHRDTLTVVMFHRVTAVGSPAQKDADPGAPICKALLPRCR